MNSFLLTRDSDRSRLIYLSLTTVAILLALYSPSPFLFILIATTLMTFSNIEKSHNKFIRFSGVLLYVMIFSWYAYHFVMWVYTHFIV